MLWNRRAYTINQTVLIISIIAILVTFIIITLGWTLLSRAGGTKLVSYIDQISHAVNAYHGTKGMFPGSGSNPILVDLDSESLIKFRKDESWPPHYYHDIGRSDGIVSMTAVFFSPADATTFNLSGGTGSYLVSEFDLVPATESNEAAKAFNGDKGVAGHLYIVDTPLLCTIENMKNHASAKATNVSTICYVGDRVS